MTLEIRQRSVAEILDGSVSLLRLHARLLVGLGLIASAPYAVAMIASRSWLEGLSQDSGEALLTNWMGFAAFAAGLVLVWALVPLSIASITGGAGELLLGRPVDFGRALRTGLRRYFPLLFTYLVVFVVLIVATGIVLLAIVFGGGGLAGGLEDSGEGVGILMTVAFVAGVGSLQTLGMLVLFMAPPVAVLEGGSPFEAVARTWDLLSGSWGRVFAVGFFAYLISLVPVMGCFLLAVPFPLAGGLLAAIAQAGAQAFTASAALLLYFDLRCRKESFDLEHLAERVGARAGRAHAPENRPPPIG